MTPAIQNILVVEDELCRSRRFLPLTYTRPVVELRSGAYSGIERLQASISRTLPEARIYLHTSKLLEASISERHGLPVNQIPNGRTLVLNARSVFQAKGIESVDVFENFPSEFCERIEQGAPIAGIGEASSGIKALWDIIHGNGELIELDIRNSSSELSKLGENDKKGVMIAGDVFVHPSAEIGLGVVLDGTNGSIVIMEGARIMAQATIIGPAVIGKGSLVKVGAKIYAGTTIGPVSKVGGEIENSIVQGYSNKQHDGYLGHSFLGEWVNLGADTNTSDLKNDYSNVKVTIENEEFDTESLFVGLLMGDHSKSAINSQFNTGTAVGVSCNVFDAGFPPKWIPNFSWGSASGFASYRFEKAIAVAKTVMERRSLTLTPAMVRVLKQLFDNQNSVSV